MRNNVPVSGHEITVPDGVMLLSMTDPKGIITYCNQEFCRISGYNSYELIGQPHNKLRHPDVPPWVFNECWSTIKSGKAWNGIFKNRCKNGDHYWVEANITPIISPIGELEGYVSFRHAPSAEHVAAAEISFNQNDAISVQSELTARHDYIVHLQQRLSSKIIALERYHERSEEDQKLGEFIMDRMLKMDEELKQIVRSFRLPAERLSGDALIAGRTPSNVLHIMLADAVGHGLAAAVSVQPVCRAFLAMTQKGFSIEYIAEELNELVCTNLPRERFITAALVSINFETTVIEVWNCGLPPLLLLSNNGNLLREWGTQAPPLGVLKPAQFTAQTASFWYEADCQLLMCSDGLAEARNSERVQFDSHSFDALLADVRPDDRLESMIIAFKAHTRGCVPHDDVTLAIVDIASTPAGEDLPKIQATEASNEVLPIPRWRIAMTLGADEIRHLDIVPLLTQLLSKVKSVGRHHSALFLILTEMFNNALDHGILKLDSALKRDARGFEQYMELRQERLHSLMEGEISIDIACGLTNNQPSVNIRIVDSGDGFDHKQALKEQGITQLHGRGIYLTQSVSHSMKYVGKGNDVRVCYCLG